MKDNTMSLFTLFFMVVTLTSTQSQDYNGNGNEQYFPQSDTQNWAAGKKVVATATCGEGVHEPELFCKLTGANPDLEGDVGNHEVIQGQYCDYCNPRVPSQTHSAEFVNDGTERWWQSPPLSRGLQYNEVNLTIDLAQELHVGYVYITMGNSPRPRVFALERSKDYGKTWTPWQFFAESEHECQHHFGEYEYSETLDADDSVLCSTRYSDVKPLEGGEIYVSLINQRPSAEFFHESEVLQEWTKATNIRLRLLKVNTLLGRLMAINQQDVTVTRRYFYSIKGISVGGSCICNGHARECTLTDPKNHLRKLCNCQHNTCGDHCDQCCPGFIQKKWRPASTYSNNECEPCQCHGHSNTCYYDEEVAKNRTSLDIHGNYEGGGVCTNCQHNTEGVNCERCRPGFYKQARVPMDARHVCAKCNCDSYLSSGSCDDETGRCQCKPEFTGPDCKRCNDGYYGYPRCKPCRCHVNGTLNKVCDAGAGRCPCKENFDGPNCDQCAQGFYNFPECKPCDCDAIGSQDKRCDIRTGQCICRPRYGGRNCGTCAHGHFNYPQCEDCGCNIAGASEEICRKDDGSCICKKNFAGERCEKCLAGFYRFPFCISCNCNDRGVLVNDCNINGQCNCKPNFVGKTCDQCAPGFYKYPECLPCGCHHIGSRGIECDKQSGVCQCHQAFDGHKCDSCKPDLYNFPECEECRCNVAGSREIPGFPLGGCGYHGNAGELCQCKERVTGRHCDVCKPGFWKLSTNNPDGCEGCNCDTRGTLGGSNMCDPFSGQCKCKPFVTGRRCDQCIDGTFGLQEHNPFGCQPCKCDVGGSQSHKCDNSGRCSCKPQIHGIKCDQAISTYYVPNLHQMIYELEDGRTSDGGQVRFGYDSNEFPGYSWRGYAIFSRIQDEVLNEVDIRKPGLYRVVYHYLNTNQHPITAEVRVTPDLHSANEGQQQSSLVTFHPIRIPDFTTVSSGGGVSSAFTLNPGRWTFSLKTAENALVDYMVLLPAAYYEAPVLREKFHMPCTVPSTSEICKHYVYLDLTPFSKVQGSSGEARDGSHHDGTQLYDNQSNLDKLGLTDMAKLDDRQTSITFHVPVDHPGKYVVVISYFTDDLNRAQDLEADISTSGGRESGVVRLANCPYSSPCRQFISDGNHNLKVVNVDGKYFTLTLTGRSDINLAIDKVYAIPLDKWHIDYIEPRFKCIYKNEKCIQGKPSGSPPGVRIEFEIGSDVTISPPPVIIEGSHPDPTIKVIKLDRRAPRVDMKVQVTPGNYALVPLYYQPYIVGFDVDVDVYAGGQYHKGTMRAHPCPSLNGCHGIVKFKDNPNVDLLDSDVRVSFNSTNPIWLDYLIIIPSVSYSEKVHSDNVEDDKSVEFINKCSDHGFNVDVGGPQFCKESIYSIATDYNNGAVLCNCNIQGSSSGNCDPNGGQCRCNSPFIIGRECSQCKTGYWGFPNCRECQCPTGICDAVTGRCVCPKLVTGVNCDTCEPRTFGYNALIGCEECDCNQNGVVNGDMECDANSGQCRCKPNIGGRKCNKCQIGHYGFPRCRPCSCDANGVLSDICDQQNGRCLCKENVEGPDCSQCKPSTFSLLASNPKGCSKCFCSGVTPKCYASDFRWAQIKELHEWTVTNTNEPAFYNDDSKTLSLSNVQLTSSSYPAYWEASHAYIGNKVRSYGGKLHYKLLSQISYESNGELFKAPEVILVGKSSRVNYVSHLDEVQNGVEHMREVHLVETKFVHEKTGGPISRDQFLILLSSLQSILIKATHFKQTSYTQLSEVSLDEARPDGWGEVAASVESCECPPNHSGSSCESCAQGYFRFKNGQCLACQCNNRATTCDQNTGVCLNCRDNFDGPQCLKCKKGYYLDRYSNVCKICACPLPIESNNFATHCDVGVSGNLERCYCLPGYLGRNCDQCAPGYWGFPRTPGGNCQKCDCNGNIDERDPSSCDPTSGRCVKCQYNTGGVHCERCADGFYGDAIDRKNCRRCDCDPVGTERCDHNTGQCICKDNVYGPQCSQCVSGSYGFHSNRGCELCSCGVAAYSTECDQHSGQCQCRDGVGGRMCDQCLDGYWSLEPRGCRQCNCQSKGAVTCDKVTGECQCLPGVTGPNCDRCMNKWIMIEGFGCKECDSCVQLLLDDIDVLHNNVTHMRDDLTSVSVSVQTIRHLENLDQRYHDLEPKVRQMMSDHPSTSHDVVESNKKIEEVHNTAKTVLHTLNRLYNDSKKTEESAIQIKIDVNDYYENNLRATGKNVDDALRKVRKMTDSLTGNTAASDVEDTLRKCSTILQEIQSKNFDQEEQRALDELNKAKNTLQRAKDLLSQAGTKVNRTTDIDISIQLILKKLHELQKLSQGSIDKSNQVFKIINDVRHIKAQVEDLISKIKASQSDIATCLEESNRLLDEANKNLNDAKNTLKNVQQDINDLKILVDQAHTFTQKLKGDNQDLSELLRKASVHTNELERKAMDLKNSIRDTESSVTLAIEASGAYDFIVTAIEEALHNSTEADRLAKEAYEISLNLSTNTDEKTRLLSDAYTEVNRIKGFIDHDLAEKLDRLKRIITNIKEVSKKVSLKEVIKGLDDLPTEGFSKVLEESKQFVEDANQTISGLAEKSKDYRERFESRRNMVGNLPTQISTINSNIRVAVQDMTNIEQDINMAITDMDSITRQSVVLDDLEAQVKANMNELRNYIRQARDAANLVTLGVNFTQQTVLQVRNSIDMPSSGMISKTSFIFQTEKPDGLLFYIGKDTGTITDYMVGEIVNGYPQFRINLGSGETIVRGTKPVNNNQPLEYKILREGKDLKLYVGDDIYPIDGEISGDSFIFHYDNDTKFYVGGVPDHVLEQSHNLSLILPRNKFVGVMENLNFDDRIVGLWNFVDASGMNGAHFKKRTAHVDDSVYTFGGNGYVHMDMGKYDPTSKLSLIFQFKTHEKDALLLFIGESTFISLEIVQGKLRLTMDLGAGVSSGLSPISVDDGEWHSFRLQRRDKIAFGTVDDNKAMERVSCPGISKELMTDGKFYVGGFKKPSDKSGIISKGFKGCIGNFTLEGLKLHFHNAIEFADIQYGCSQGVRVVSFPPSSISPGYIQLFGNDFSISNEFTMSFKFRSDQSDALIFYVFDSGHNSGLSLALVGGYLKLIHKDEGTIKDIKLPEQVNDGAWHYVNFKRIGNAITLEADDKHSLTANTDTRPRIPDNQLFYLGGVPDSVHIPTENAGSTKPFVGCIGDVTVNSKFVNVADSRSSTVVNVNLASCQFSDYLPPQGRSYFHQGGGGGGGIDGGTGGGGTGGGVIQTGTNKTCALPVYSKDVWWGRESSDAKVLEGYYEYQPAASSINKFVISMEIKASSPDGVLFYTYHKTNSDFIALYLNGGHVVGAFNCGGGIVRIENRKLVLDEKRHKVIFSYSNKQGTLSVDNIQVQQQLIGQQTSVEINSNFYLAGLPFDVLSQAARNLGNIRSHQFSGCLTNVMYQDRPLGQPIRTPGRTSGCSVQEDGVFFFAPPTPNIRTYGVIASNYVVPQHFELSVKIKPRVMNAVLMSVHNPATDDYLVLQMVDGKMFFSMSNADHENVSASSRPISKTDLCDGNWHDVTARKVKNVVFVTVDNIEGIPMACTEGVDQTDTRNDLYIGGFKDLHHGLKVSNSYVGCMKDLTITDVSISLREMHDIQGDILHSGCPTE